LGSTFFFYLRLRGILGFLTLFFLELPHGGHECSDLSIIKKRWHMPVSRRRPCPLGGACGTPQWLLIAFHNGNRSITPPSIQWADVRWPPWHERALVIIFLLPYLFSLLHLKRCTGLAKLQSGHQSFNCIEFNLFIFQFYPLKIDFLCFFYQIWSSFWFLIILLLIFFIGFYFSI
jgi:hypothetical protein